MTSAARALAHWAAGHEPDALPVAVRQSAVMRVLDTVGCALAAAAEDCGRPAVGVAARWGGGGSATVLGRSLRVAPPSAALANGYLAHALDFDDTHAPSITHASAVLVPTVLALAESESIDGPRTLTALVAGYEAITRLGMATSGRFHARGWHATAVCGAFGAALAAGRCLGLDTDRLAGAVGIAASMASGVLEFLEDGSSVKQLHPGWAAHSGVLAAGLAEEGMTGPATGLEGRFGFYRAALGEAPDLEPLLGGLGLEWETLAIGFKPYPCCHYSHAYLDAVARLKRDPGLTPDEVGEVECLVPQGEVPIICEPLAAKRRPRTPYDAKFSLPFSVAAALLEDRVGVHSFTETRITDPGALALAARVRYTVDPDSRFPQTFPGWVRVRLRDGRVLEARQADNRGGPAEPLSSAEILEKFRENARRALAPDRVDRLEAALLELERARDLRPLLALCRRG